MGQHYGPPPNMPHGQYGQIGLNGQYALGTNIAGVHNQQSYGQGMIHGSNLAGIPGYGGANRPGMVGQQSTAGGIPGQHIPGVHGSNIPSVNEQQSTISGHPSMGSNQMYGGQTSNLPLQQTQSPHLTNDSRNFGIAAHSTGSHISQGHSVPMSNQPQYSTANGPPNTNSLNMDSTHHSNLANESHHFNQFTGKHVPHPHHGHEKEYNAFGQHHRYTDEILDHPEMFSQHGPSADNYYDEHDGYDRQNGPHFSGDHGREYNRREADYDNRVRDHRPRPDEYDDRDYDARSPNNRRYDDQRRDYVDHERGYTDRGQDYDYYDEAQEFGDEYFTPVVQRPNTGPVANTERRGSIEI